MRISQKTGTTGFDGCGWRGAPRPLPIRRAPQSPGSPTITDSASLAASPSRAVGWRFDRAGDRLRFEVHRQTWPRLLESAYEACVCFELHLGGDRIGLLMNFNARAYAATNIRPSGRPPNRCT